MTPALWAALISAVVAVLGAAAAYLNASTAARHAHLAGKAAAAALSTMPDSTPPAKPASPAG